MFGTAFGPFCTFCQMTTPTKAIGLALCLLFSFWAWAQPKPNKSASKGGSTSYDLVVVGGTPGGLMAAIEAARAGRTALVLERTSHIGGLPANGLGATDIATRGCTGGLFLEFVNRIKAHYVKTYGENSEQVKVCQDGYHFEPSVAEKILEGLVAEQGARITVLKMRQFDFEPQYVRKQGRNIRSITVLNRLTKQRETYSGRVFVDGTYEGDLAAAAGVSFRTGREGFDQYREPLAGKVYKAWGGAVDSVHSTFQGDTTIQAYNYRLCLTDDSSQRRPIAKPKLYNPSEFESIIEDIRSGFVTEFAKRYAKAGVTNPVALPNRKTDSNNHHGAMLSTDLPEENWPWPKANWAWRDAFAERLKDYTLGLLWFVQNDPRVPEEFRQKSSRFGLSTQEYQDNDNFPRQVYVREGRRINGWYNFTAHDALPDATGTRPVIHQAAITTSHYAIDSHACYKREKDRIHLDGFISYKTEPYTVPVGVMLPQDVDNLVVPVAVSATHLGFGTLRMEPCWMALGQAAGATAHLYLKNKSPRLVDVPTGDLQSHLIRSKAVLVYYKDVPTSHPAYYAIQKAGLAGLETSWNFTPDASVDYATAFRWQKLAGKSVAFTAGKTTRAQLAESLFGR